MLSWIIANLGTLIIGLIVLCCIAAVIAGMVIKKKKGKRSCSCGCAGCPLSGKCSK